MLAMKLISLLLATLFAAVFASEAEEFADFMLEDEIEEEAFGHSRRLAFDRIKVLIYEKDIKKNLLESDGIKTSSAPFYLKNGNTGGTYYVSEFAADDGSCHGIVTLEWKGDNGVTLQYSCGGSLDAITGGWGTYLGANGEAIFSSRPATQTFLLKIII